MFPWTRRQRRFIAFAMAVISVGALAWFVAWVMMRQARFIVRGIEIFDADSIKTKEKGGIRFKHCDAPERWMHGGVLAAERLRELILGADDVRLEYDDPPQCDAWGRVIGVLYINGEDACAILIRESRAKLYEARKHPPCKH